MSQDTTAAAPAAPATATLTGGGDAAPAAAAAPAAPAGTPAPAAAEASDWTSGFADEMKGYVQNKGFKDPKTLLESYRNLEKLVGAPKDQLIKLPQKEDDPAWAEIFERLGKPKEAKEYGLKAPEGGDGKFAEWAEGTFHELNLTRAQAAKLVEKFNAYQTGGEQEAKQAMQLKHQGEINVLKQEWAGVFEQNTQMVEAGAQALGLSEKQLLSLRDSMGPLAAMKMLHSVGQKIGEPVYVSGEGATGRAVNTPGQALARITELKSDSDFTRRYLAGEEKAKQEMARLHEIAYPGMA